MLCELGNPFKRNQRVRASPQPPPALPGAPQVGGVRPGGSTVPPVLQAELIITFEAIGIMLDTREVLVWLELST